VGFPRFRPIAAAIAAAITVLAVIALWSASAAPVAARTGAVPAGTTLRVADQFEGLELPLQLSGQGAKLPFGVQYSSFVGAPAVFQAFEAGAVDLSYVGDAGIIPPQESGQSFVVVAAYKNTGGGWGILVGPGKSITSIRQLRGKKIGFEAGTADQSYLLQLLKDNGLTPKDVTLVNLPSADIPAALHSGDIDATPSEVLTSEEYEADNPGSKIISTPGVYSGLDFIVTTKSALDSAAKRAAISDYLRSLVRAENWVNNHESSYVSAYYNGALKLPTSLDKSILADTAPTHFVPIGPAVINTQQGTTNLFTSSGAIPGHLNVSKVFTTEFNAVVESAG
jgi:sulfonate transport system substrate-binding protein